MRSSYTDRRSGSRDGFTILEMLVAVALTTMLLGILYNVFNNANQVSRKTEAWIEIHQNARSLYGFLARDLAGAFVDRQGRYFMMKDATYSDGNSDSHDKDMIQLTSRTVAPEGEIAEVGYYLEESGDIDDLRYSEVGRFYDYAGDSGTDDDLDFAVGAEVWSASASKAVIARGVTDLNMEYLNKNGGWSDFPGGGNFTNYNALTDLNGLPRLIRVTTYITDHRGILITALNDDKSACGKGLKFVWTFGVGAQ